MNNEFAANKTSRSKVIASVVFLTLVLLFLSALDAECKERFVSWDELEAEVRGMNSQFPIVTQQNELLKIEAYKAAIDRSNSSMTNSYRIKLNANEIKEQLKKGLISQHQTCDSFATKLFNTSPVIILRAEYMFEDGEKVSAEIKRSDCIFDSRIGERSLTLEQELEKWNKEMSFKISILTVKKAFYNKIDNSIVMEFVFEGATDLEYKTFINRPAKLVREDKEFMCKHYKVFFSKHNISQITNNYNFDNYITHTSILRKTDCKY